MHRRAWKWILFVVFVLVGVRQARGQSASFVGYDTTTQGSWHGVYGGDGYSIEADPGGSSVPSYATFTPQNDLTWTWAGSTTDVRALQNGANTGRLAACWYQSSTFDLDVNITDSNTHQFALYAVDWDTTSRSETIQIVNANTNSQLDSRTLSSFSSGVYLVWNISGHVKINVTNTGSPNGVVSGVFFGGSGSTGSYTHESSITIHHALVLNTLTNFPVLISGQYSYLATIANGGNVINENGYDIIFTSDSACQNILSFEQESYVATNGKINYWVKISTLSSTADTVIYMCYGNSSVTSFQGGASGAVWDGNYVAVYHFPDGTTLSPKDSTANGKTATINGSIAATTGWIDGGATGFSSSSYISTPITNTFGDFTASIWFNATGSSVPAQRLLDKYYGAGFWMGQNATTGGINSWGGGIEQASSPYGTYVNLTAGSWHLLVMTRSGTTQTIYGDGGAQIQTTTVSSSATDSSPLYIGDTNNSDTGGSFPFTGIIDEVQISNIARSSGWIATQYNNQSNPNAFYTIGSAGGGSINVTVSPSTATLGQSQTQQFTSTVTGTSNQNVTWSISPSVGGISSAGLYTAPTTISGTQTVTVTATSQASSSATGTATVTLTQVSVSVSPSTYMLHANGQQQFTASVTGASNQNVTWSINPSMGSLSSTSANPTTYTAPATITTSQTVTLTATSADDGTVVGTASITLSPPTGPSVYYYIEDQLGTSRVIYDSQTGSICYDADFYPFGGERPVVNTCPQNYKFTGKERDGNALTETGLDNFGARYYSSVMARFMSPDPAGGKRADPQTLNRYSYVRNNPLKITDPTGLYLCADDQNKCKTKNDRDLNDALLQLRFSGIQGAAIAAAYGQATKDNGVTVDFKSKADMGKGNMGITDFSATRLANGMIGDIHITVDFLSGLRSKDLEQTVAHEGSHIQDDMSFFQSFDFLSHKFNSALNFYQYDTEFKAFEIGAMVKPYRDLACGGDQPCGDIVPGPRGYANLDRYLTTNPQYVEHNNDLQFDPKEWPQ